jgi:endonuclease YncB( thermonuclease family)
MTVKQHQIPKLCWAIILLVGAASIFGIVGVRAGDSLYGKVVAIKGPVLVTFDYGAGNYDIRLTGIAVPRQGKSAMDAERYLAKILLNRSARLRFDGRTPEGQMMGRVYTDDPEIGIVDVGLEMVRTGFATQSEKVAEYKYGELATAMEEARARKLGVWAK